MSLLISETVNIEVRSGDDILTASPTFSSVKNAVPLPDIWFELVDAVIFPVSGILRSSDVLKL